MAKTDFKTPDDYIQTLPKDVQTILNEVRQTIQKAVPEAEEVISYQIPAFKYHGWIFYVSAYQKHFSLFLSTAVHVRRGIQKRIVRLQNF
jgi:uncharacterized protein YdhG (YjbR/CyaY superfamily)